MEALKRIGLVGFGVVLGLLGSARLGCAPKTEASPQPSIQALPGGEGQSPFVSVVEKLAPSVVSINVESKETIAPPVPFFRFEIPGFPGFPEMVPGVPVPKEGVGSGFVYKKAKGGYYIITNNHVIKGADKIRVSLYDGSVVEPEDVEVVGADPLTDIAVIKIKTQKELPPAELGNSDSIRVGEWAIAIGSPFRLPATVTVGVISALHRTEIGNNPEGYHDYIQTDAAINPGNSGGPLADIRGRVIGVNTAIISTTGGYEGIGFAIPINLARAVADQLIKKGRVRRGWLGVQIQDLTPALAEYYELESPRGALVASVVDGSPAQKAGLKEGDIILEVNGERIKDVQHLRTLIAHTEPGTQVKLKILRNGKAKEIKVKLGELPEEYAAAEAPAPGGPSAHSETKFLGMKVAEKGGKVVVVSVEPGSPAQRVGIREGDVILRIGKYRISNLSDYEKAAKAYSGSKLVVMQLQRGNAKIFIGIKP